MENKQTVSLYALIKWALEEDTEREIAALPTPQELEALYPDTSAFRQRVFGEIERMQKEERHKRHKRHKPLRIVKRTLFVAAILISIFFCVILTSAAVRNAVVNTIIEWTNRDIGIRFEIEGEPLTALPAGYGPHYIPEGFEFVEAFSYYEEADGSFYYDYETEDGSRILDIQASILQNGSMTWMDNEHAEYEMITFQNVSAYLGHGTSVSGDEIYIMLWAKNGIEHFIYGTVSLSDLFKIAENIY